MVVMGTWRLPPRTLKIFRRIAGATRTKKGNGGINPKSYSSFELADFR